ncbi:uncharacterized protein LOC107422466 isoform X2 [Ziziphus jujuba]|uniref:Uncharacterized protein LOC107422466 isoform X2 n=1 Tax=Ziziphus jujuba TaxID=326968 RepID=A0A6P4A2V0_ZIZJJ|nr:uncharacterized protein LOC107422466 isoform X2 [Ziziphus jujuba]
MEFSSHAPLSRARVTRQLFKACLWVDMQLRTSSTTLNCGTDLLSNCTTNSHFHVPHQSTKLSFYHPLHRLNFTSPSCNSNPSSSSSSSSSISHSASELGDFNQESKTNDLNLKGIARSLTDIEESRNSKTVRESSYCKYNRSMIPKAPSFSIYNSAWNETHDGDQNPEEEMNQEGLERTVTIGDSIEAIDGSKLSCGKKSMGLIEEEQGAEEQDGIRNLDVKDELARPVSPPLHLATGLGVDSPGFGFDGDDIDLSRNVEGYYKSMVDVHPFNPLVLRNYAQFLQSNGDLHGAEEYYSRAVLADPEDGEVMAKYAKLIWTLHRDKERALSYFKRAAETALQDSHVQAAYASFLWEIEDDEEEEEYHQKLAQNQSIDALDISNGDNIEENYRKMVESNPTQPLSLKNYAQFLYQIKEDPQSAEQYYSRAIQADPEDAETMVEYARLVWQLHHDSDKASSYFEQAVQAAPSNSDVVAAYAHFLWEIEEEEDNVKQDDQIEVHA